MNKFIYLDNSATTPVKKEVVLAMKPYWNKFFGNPGSITKLGVKAKQVVEDCRKKIADILKARASEIIFTAGGTEANNLAIFGVVNHLLDSPSRKIGINQITDLHFITTNIEHSSISECFKELERRGAKVSYLKVNSRGLVDIKDLRKMINPKTVLISIGYVNNEIWTIQPIKEIAKEIRHARKSIKGRTLNLQKGSTLVTSTFPLFHTDASQASLYSDLNLNELGVDMLTLDAQKMFGPKGIGVLFIRGGIKISPIIFGGGQERGLRSGTENVPLVVGLTKSLEIARQDFGSKSDKVKLVRNYFWQKIKKEIPEAILNGDLENRLPNNLNISIPGLDSEFTVLCLDEEEIICSTRSACAHDKGGSSVVRCLYSGQGLILSEMEARAKSTLRFSLSEYTTKKDIDFVVSRLKAIIKKQVINNFV